MDSEFFSDMQFITLYEKDVDILQKKGVVVQEFGENLEKKLIFKVRDEEIEYPGYTESPGCSIYAEPDKRPISQALLIEVQLSREHFNKLINGESGWFVTRCKYDRCNIYYRKKSS